ncbi:major intrinsic protein [Thalassoporum mexicanum PCC 7367]|uniref:aquaporin n=1 Tax=Thalassoporum mexicanum TaxID=3457544 RepID=UPI00029FAE98|nr:aquaporin [Pseudanabaena sp. PCC 7367]AFY69303.1 major intrinsic protein [Pseudanabaena sp. PCC 7367]
MFKGNLIKEFCELIGTAVLVFMAIGINAFSGGGVAPAEASVATGAVLMLIIYGVGTISGAHVNPAVTLGFLTSGRFPQGQFFRYVAAQVLGAIVAMILLFITVPGFDWVAAAPVMGSPVSFGLEVFTTGFLVFTIFSVATGDCRICPDARPLAGVIIGAAIAMLSFFAGSAQAGILNPVVPFIFAIAAGTWLELVKYLAAMAIGAVLATFVYQFTRYQPKLEVEVPTEEEQQA